jgi:hypothetical protein
MLHYYPLPVFLSRENDGSVKSSISPHVWEGLKGRERDFSTFDKTVKPTMELLKLETNGYGDPHLNCFITSLSGVKAPFAHRPDGSPIKGLMAARSCQLD